MMAVEADFLVVLGLLMLQHLGADQGKKFLVQTDNTTTYSTMHRRRSRDHWVNKEWKILQRVLLAEEIDVHPLWIASGDNKADGLSGGVWGDHSWRDNLSIELPEDLTPFLCQQWWPTPMPTIAKHCNEIGNSP
jgi:hypothetical protein